MVGPFWQFFGVPFSARHNCRSSETSKPGFWLVCITCLYGLNRTCVGIIILSLSWLISMSLMYVTLGVLHEWRLVTCLSRSCLRRCVLWSWLVLSFYSVWLSFYLEKERERRVERAETHAMCCAVTWGTKPHIQRPRGDEANRGKRWSNQNRAPRHNAQQIYDTLWPQLRRHT